MWLMWPSAQLIGKGIRASSQLFIRRAADVISEACFTAMTGDRHDELAAMDFSMIAVALIPSWFVWILTIMPVWLHFSSFLFCFVLFCFWTRSYIYHRVLAVFDVYYRQLIIETSVKTFKTWTVRFIFSWAFLSVLAL